MRSVIPGLWNPLAYIGGGGLALRWFRDQFYNTHKSLPLPEDENLYTELMALAARIPPGSDGLLFSPHLGGRICPSSPQMRGAWMGISWSHTQAHFFRAILESVAFEYAYYLDVLRELLPQLTLVEARVVGGGARGPAWNQIKADVLGVPYQRLKGNEFGTWGAAMIAGKAVGAIDDLAAHAASTSHREGEQTQPDTARHAAYAPLVRQYIRMESFLQSYYTEISL
jgi:xylulokinase